MAEYENLKNQTEEFYDPNLAWRVKEPASHKEICIRAMENCRIEWSKDYREGGNYQVQTSKGVLPVYFPDQKEVCINATQTFYDLMLYYFDDKAEEKIGEIKKAIENFIKNFEPFRENLRKSFGPRYRKEADEEAEKRLANFMMKQYREMFRELILLFKRKNELSGKKKIGAY